MVSPLLQSVTPEECYLFVSKYISFEEPVSKQAQIAKVVKRLAGRFSLGFRNSSSEALFGHLCGDLVPTDADRLFNAIFALEETSLFTENAFVSWFSRYQESELQRIQQSKDLEKYHPPTLKRTLKLLLAKRGLTENAGHWVNYWNMFGVPWSDLLAKIRSDDRHLLFVSDVLEEFKRAHLTDFSSLDEAHERFGTILGQWRSHLAANLLPKGIALVEGTTELILLPHFASLLGFSFNKLAVLLLPAGGANQVLRRYLHLKKIVQAPIVCLLDKDAAAQSTAIKQSLRAQDAIHIVAAGEIEDSFGLPVFSRLLNLYLQNKVAGAKPIESGEVAIEGLGRCESISRLLRERGIDFDKVEFARIVALHLNSLDEIPPDLRYIVSAICQQFPS